jgi:GNAT superfamily N-acetyltransferase
MAGPSADLASVRWLAERCGMATPAPAPRLASVLLSDPEHADRIRTYLAWWMRHPDDGSTFAEQISPLREMPDALVIPALADLGYEGLVYLCEERVTAHVFFQEHGADLCAFSVAVAPDHRGGNLGASLLLDFVAYAAQRSATRRARVGTGRNHVTQVVLQAVGMGAAGLGWRVSTDGWIDFAAPLPR